MTSFSPQFLDEIRARVRVSDVVGRRVKLERRGREFVGLSPFSPEKTPSFTVSDEKGFYHCFSTQEHGDVFAFVMKTQGLTFPEAVRELAAEAGIELPKPTPADARRDAEAKALGAIIEAACGLYEDALWGPEGVNALAYLREARGLTDATIKRFRLGYAPPGNWLKARLLARGVAETLLFDTKLIAPGKEGRESFDFFRDRVLFPIMDVRGRPVAFGGRVMGDGEPKYLNSADHALFHKGKQLYGLSQARAAAIDAGEIVMVEGYVDVIAMAQAGIANVVAPLGTALTETQLALLWRYAPEPVLCFDNDKAGRAAAVKAAARALPELKPGFSLRFARVTGGKDPDEICRSEGADAMRAVLAETDPLSDVIWAQLEAEVAYNTPERRAGFVAEALKRAGAIKDPHVRAQYEALFRERMEALFKTSLPLPARTAEPGPPPDEGGDDEAPPDPIAILGQNCPITALGRSKRKDANGNTSTVYWHFIDSEGQSQSLSTTVMRSAAHIEQLFGGETKWLTEMASNLGADGRPLPGDRATWKLNVIRPLLMRACTAEGFFDPENSIRGPGIWPYGAVKEWPRRDPRVVVHTGDWVYVVDPAADDIPGFAAGRRIGDFIYARAEAEDDLADDALSDEEAHDLVIFYRHWSWKETAEVLGVPLVGFLLFGHLASSMITALLEHRPTVFLMAPSNAGKSEVLTHHQGLLGSTALRYENATMTGLRTAFVDPQPVRALLCNEANERGNPQAAEKLREVLDLALYCYTSGEGRQARGPGGISGYINASFMFAAVRPPKLQEDDANRMLILNMDLLPWSSSQAVTEYKRARDGLRSLGPKLRRRMVDRWGEFPVVLEAFAQELRTLRYVGREVDTFATLMACAWLGSREGLPTGDQCRQVASAVSASMFVEAMNEADPEWKRCWIYLTTAKVEWQHGRKITIGELIKRAIAGRFAVNDEASAALKDYGLAYVRRTLRSENSRTKAEQRRPPPHERLAVAYSHQALEELFKGSDWKGGKWAVLSQMPGVEGNHAAGFAGIGRAKAWLIPIDDFLPQDGDDAYADDPVRAERDKEAADVK